jgi:hypothetical protein
MKFQLRLCALLAAVSITPLVADVPATPPASPPAPAAAGSAVTPAPVDPAKEAEIRKLLQVTGTVKMVDQMKQQMFAVFRQRAGQLPQQFWDKMDKEMDAQDLVNRLIPLYDKYYTLDDLKAVNAFYQTPAGQHLLQIQPQILKESMAVGEEWGRSAGMKVMLEMQDYQQHTNPAPAASGGTP